MARFPTTYAVLKTLAQSSRVLADSLRGRLDPARADRIIHDWAHSLVDHAEVELDVRGAEHVPRDRACVVMSNHQSHFDVPISFVVYPGRLRMVGKKELFRLPVFGAALRSAGMVSVDRAGDRSQAKAAMSECADALARGSNIWIAPEGTRSLDGRIGAFKKGGFYLARETGAPILPMAIDGSRNVLGKHARRVHLGVPVRVTFGAPLSQAGRSLEETMADVRAFMEMNVTDPTL